jgi:hypothetical protein
MGVERVVDDGLVPQDLVVILEPEVAKAFGDRLETCRLGSSVEVTVDVGAMDDLGEEPERWMGRAVVPSAQPCATSVLRTIPTMPAAKMSAGSETPLTRTRMASATRAITAVGRS